MSVSRTATAARPSIQRSVAAVLLGASLVFGAVACGSDSPKGAEGSTSKGATVDTLAPPTKVDGTEVTVKAIDNDFEPKHLQIKAGTSVTFDNVGRNLHDVKPNDPKSFDFSISTEDFAPGATKTFKFDKPGTYAYYCTLHATATAGSMRGVITVEP